MEIELKNVSKEYGLDWEDVTECDNPFEVCDAFLDEKSKAIYFPADDKGNGPFWLQLRDGLFNAYAPSNLPLEGNLIEIHPRVIIEY